MHYKSFISNFALPELRSILSNWRLLSFLLLIVVLCFWSLGFSNGSQKYLKEKMDSPFVKFLNVTIERESAKDNQFMKRLMETLDRNDSIKDQFHILKSFSFPFQTLEFYRNDKAKTLPAKIMPMSYDNALYEFLHQEEIMLTKAKRFEDTDWSVIVSVKYLNELGFSEQDLPSFIDYNYFSGDSNQSPIIAPIPVAAVARQLPYECDVIISWKFFQAYKMNDNSPLDVTLSEHLNYYQFFVPDNSRINLKKEDRFKVVDNDLTYQQGQFLQFYGSDYSESEVEQLVSMGIDGAYLRTFDYDVVAIDSEFNRTDDLLTVQLNDLTAVNELKEFISNEFSLDVDMTTIESRNNFYLFNQISNVLSLILSSFSMVFIIYVVTRVIIEHIEKNAKNLGTLKAFGLSNLTISIVYSAISAFIVFVMIGLAFVLMYLLGYGLTPVFLRSVEFSSESASQMFEFDFSYKILFMFIILPIALISTLIYLKLRKTTPGDFIYERG